MAKEITLPSGATVRMREPETLLIKDRDKVAEIASKAEGEMMQAISIIHGLIAVSVVEWSFDLVPPSIRIASLGELTPRDYDALSEAVAPAAEYLFPSVAATKENEENPKAPTANSND